MLMEKKFIYCGNTFIYKALEKIILRVKSQEYRIPSTKFKYDDIKEALHYLREPKTQEEALKKIDSNILGFLVKCGSVAWTVIPKNFSNITKYLIRNYPDSYDMEIKFSNLNIIYESNCIDKEIYEEKKKFFLGSFEHNHDNDNYNQQAYILSGKRNSDLLNSVKQIDKEKGHIILITPFWRKYGEIGVIYFDNKSDAIKYIEAMEDKIWEVGLNHYQKAILINYAYLLLIDRLSIKPRFENVFILTENCDIQNRNYRYLSVREMNFTENEVLISKIPKRRDGVNHFMGLIKNVACFDFSIDYDTPQNGTHSIVLKTMQDIGKSLVNEESLEKSLWMGVKNSIEEIFNNVEKDVEVYFGREDFEEYMNSNINTCNLSRGGEKLLKGNWYEVPEWTQCGIYVREVSNGE